MAQKVEIQNGPLHVTEGRLGVGTNNPLAKFQVTDSLLWHLRLDNPGTGGDSWYIGASQNSWNAGGRKFLISPTSASSSSVFTIDSLNQVGIKEFQPEHPFHVGANTFFETAVGINEPPGSSGQPLGVRGDFAMGGGADGFDASAEAIVIRAQSDTWYLGARNTSTPANTSLFIGRNGSGDGTFNITNDGKVGIGTAAPASNLDVTKQNSNTSQENLRLANYGTGDVTQRFSAGFAFPTFRQYLIGIDQSDNRKFKFSTSTSNSNITSGTIMTLHPDQKVSINSTTVPAEYHFAVDGKIISEGVTVRLSQTWPDYVFDADYPLMPLDDVANHIRENKHLPNIPSASDIKKEGLSLEKLQVRMMEKIEELTLYLIDQQNEIKELKSQLKLIQDEK